jgi:glycosyltransferase involved in cell wall biosynthesis/phosphatidylglycerophosphate synthase
MVGTRGVPARYGGFETAIEEVGSRLADRGHAVRVYCRPVAGSAPLTEHLGMTLVSRPALRRRSLETLSHTGLSALHLLGRRTDVAFVFNCANAPFLPMLRAARIPVATHVDGLEWKRAKWGPTGRRYYRRAEALAVRWSDALIADAQGIADYYRDEFGAVTSQLAYGAPVLTDPASDRLAELDLTPGGYHVVVARFEPENHVELAVRGYVASDARRPLVVVGSAPYSDEYTRRVHAAAAGDSRVRFLGGVWDQEQLDQLYAHALTYVHGHSVGGTNPSLLRAIGAGVSTVAYDVSFNREVLREHGRYFTTADDLARRLEEAELDPAATADRGRALQAVAALAGAQKGAARGAPAYSRFVNRRLGRLLAAWAYRRGLSPNGVTGLSALATFTGIALLALLPASWPLGIGVALLLVLGYALDSADGQVARLTGTGSPAGEWLDHMVDATKISTLPLALAVGLYRFDVVDDVWLLVPLLHVVAGAVLFFGMILTEQLRRARGVQSVAPTEGRAPWLRSVLVMPTDYGVLCLAFALLGAPPVFMVVYGLIVLATTAFVLAAAVKWYRELRDLSARESAMAA